VSPRQHPAVEYVTIGAGWTAGILAQQLTADGHDVLSLERGTERWTTPDFEHNHDSLRYLGRKEMMLRLDEESWTWRPNPRARSLPMRQYGSFHPGQGNGGAGVHWAAETWRFYPSDMRYRSHHVERYGEDKLPEGNRIQDWPITYDELEPYYDRFEYDIGISGRAGHLRGERVEGGNVFEGSRRREYPLPPLERSLAADRFSAACRELGYHPFPQPSAILSEAYTDVSGRTRSGCLYCGFCTRYGCEVDAKGSAIVSHIPLALATGHYEIRNGCTVTGIVCAEDGRATGVSYVDRAGREHFQPAGTVIVSAYAINNVKQLLVSRSRAHPDGVGNDRGLVGKNYTYQLVKSPVEGLFSGRRFNQFMGNSGLQDIIHDFNADNFDHGDLDFVGGASIACGGGERQPLTSVGGLPFGDGQRWGQALKEALRNEWDSVISINIQGESLPYEDQFIDLDPVYTDVHGLPLVRITYDFHRNDYLLYRYLAARCTEIMQRMGATQISSSDHLGPYEIATYQSTHCTGGAIMGTDPGNSVTNKYGQVWDTPNVFVTGATLYPQNPGMNPTGPLCALAYLTAEALKDRYDGDLLD
jgi:gluconate 2-dehydrogenase alpha chain